jgi:hypothetical protein
MAWHSTTPMPPEYAPTFTVEHVDSTHRSQVIGSNLTLAQAVAMAKAEAQRRGLGRMFRAGSIHVKDVIVITENSP